MEEKGLEEKGLELDPRTSTRNMRVVGMSDRDMQGRRCGHSRRLLSGTWKTVSRTEACW